MDLEYFVDRVVKCNYFVGTQKPFYVRGRVIEVNANYLVLETVDGKVQSIPRKLYDEGSLEIREL